MERFIDFHKATYYNTLLSMLVYVLAVIWFVRSMFTRGFVRTAKSAAIKST